MSDDEPTWVVSAKAIGQTAKALQVVLLGVSHRPTVWVPQQLIHADSEVYKEGNLVILLWFAEKQGWV